MFPLASARLCQTSSWAGRRIRVVARDFLGPAAMAASLSGCVSRATPVDEAALLAEKGQERAAIQLLESAVAKHPEGDAALDERRLLVRLSATTGDLGAAQRWDDELRARLPKDSPIPDVELGHALEIAHRYDEALALYDRAAEIAPKDPLGPRTGGLRAARWGESELAQPRLEESLRRDPRDATVWHALGLVSVQLGELDAARVAYQSGLVADPHALENRIGLATLALRKGDAAGALVEYDAVLARDPNFADGHLGRSWALIALGRFDEARAALALAARLGGDGHAIARQEKLIDELSAARARAGARSSAR
jgi:tetratricopeptide (TPR) repeat protein